jgi:hypothetical protein
MMCVCVHSSYLGCVPCVRCVSDIVCCEQGAVVRNKHGFKRSYSQLPLQTVFNSIIPAAIAGMHSRRGLDVGQRKRAQEVDRQEVLSKVCFFVLCVYCLCAYLPGCVQLVDAGYVDGALQITTGWMEMASITKKELSELLLARCKVSKGTNVQHAFNHVHQVSLSQACHVYCL